MAKDSNLLAKLLAYIFLLALLVLGNVLTMIYGWGLTPHSWWWIIGFGFFGLLAIKIVQDKLK